MWSPKSRKKSVNKIFPKFLVARWKILVANFSFKNQNEENMFAFGAPMAIYATEKPRQMNRMPAISRGLYTQFHKTAKCLKSTLYLLLSLPLGEEMYPIEELPVGSLLYVQNRERSFLSRSVKTIDGSPCCSHQATTMQHFSFKKHGGKALHCLSCVAL